MIERPTLTATELLAAKIQAHDARTVVVGLGYIGLPLLAALARAGFPAFGFETNEARVQAITEGRPVVEGVDAKELSILVRAEKIGVSSQADILNGADVVVLCVPTPLADDGSPDTHALDAAVADLVAHARADMLVVLESTSYPGTTREIAAKLADAGFSIGEEIFVACSPERIDPGNPHFSLQNTPRVIGGVSPSGARMASLFYRQIVDEVVVVTDSNAAEVVKLYENTFRAVNVGLVNELAVAAKKLGVDIWEVVDAAATKPFGFMKFTPGPGVGGPCVPAAARTLAWKMSQFGVTPDFLDLATTANERMPHHVLLMLEEALAKKGAPPFGARILLAGVAYKPGVSDLRGAPALTLLDLLIAREFNVSYMDPHVPSVVRADRVLEAVPTTTSFADYDAIVVLTAHPRIDVARMVAEAKLIVDTRNATAPFLADAKATVVRL